MPAELRLPATPSGVRLANMLAKAHGVGVTDAGETVAIRSPKPITITVEQVEAAFYKRRSDPEFGGLWHSLFADHSGELVIEEGAAVIVPTDAESPDQGWHIRVPRAVHNRWREAAQSLGLTKKAFTTLCLEHYIREHMKDIDQGTLTEEAKRGLAQMLQEALS